MRFYLEQQELVTLRANGTNPMGEPPNVDLSLSPDIFLALYSLSLVQFVHTQVHILYITHS